MTRTFAVASDEAVVALIAGARDRIVVIAPALTHAIAEAVARRLDDLGKLDVTVILDSDPEVYRLGFGDRDALDTIRKASAGSHFDLREQPGVRIGVIVSDETAMVYAPISKNIEAGSTSVERPNAIVLKGAAADRVAAAAGAYTGGDALPREVGDQALKPAKVERMQSDLTANPPRPFDITRRLNVFSSKVQFVEIKARKYRMSRHQIRLPSELLDVTDTGLRDRISGSIGLPLDGIGALEITIEHDGKPETLEINQEWLEKERQRIEKTFTFAVGKYGRVILRYKKDELDRVMSRFTIIVEKYQVALRAALAEKQSEFEAQIVAEYSPRWQRNPPEHLLQLYARPSSDDLKSALQSLARRMFEEAIDFDPPVVKVLYKNVAPESLEDAEFLSSLRESMVRKGAPPGFIDSLFETGQAAPAAGAFLNR